MAAATDDAAGAALAALDISPGERFIAVSVRSGSPSSEVIAEALRSAVSRKLADCVLLFGMQRYWRDCDDDVVRDVERRLTPLRVRVAPEWSAPLLKAVVARAQAAIACRYHAAVFALTSGTPAVSIAVQPEYEWKLRGIYDQFEHAEWLTPPRNLASTLLDVLRRRELFSTELREKERLLRPRVARLTDAVADVLRGRRFAA
jgi:polysaccharide pyruvyl transferase WcaK-like protein